MCSQKLQKNPLHCLKGGGGSENSEFVLGGDCLTNSGELIEKGYDKYK